MQQPECRQCPSRSGPKARQHRGLRFSHRGDNISNSKDMQQPECRQCPSCQRVATQASAHRAGLRRSSRKVIDEEELAAVTCYALNGRSSALILAQSVGRVEFVRSWTPFSKKGDGGNGAADEPAGRARSSRHHHRKSMKLGKSGRRESQCGGVWAKVAASNGVAPDATSSWVSRDDEPAASSTACKGMFLAEKISKGRRTAEELCGRSTGWTVAPSNFVDDGPILSGVFACKAVGQQRRQIDRKAKLRVKTEHCMP
eukprot:6206858-Pleurochrysis_carterae.AAC.7